MARSPCAPARWYCPNACCQQRFGTDCSPGQTECSATGNALGTCASSGTWGAPVSCGSSASCVATEARRSAGKRAVGSTTCGGANGVQTCTSSGTWGPAVGCGNQTGDNGTCVGSCSTGADGVLRQRGRDLLHGGGWGAPAACNDQTCIGSVSGAGADGAHRRRGCRLSAALSAACIGTCAPNQVTCNGQQGPRSAMAADKYRPGWQNSGSACARKQDVLERALRTGVCGPVQVTWQRAAARGVRQRWAMVNNGTMCKAPARRA